MKSAILGIIFIIVSSTVCNAQTSEKLDTVKTTIIMQVGNPIIIVNGKEQNNIHKAAPIIQNKHTLVPIRTIVEAMGGNANWDEKNKEITLSIDNNILKLTINSTTVYLNGEKYIMNIPLVIINSQTMLPIRFIAESFGFEVDWNEANQKITIIKEKETDNMFDIKLNIGSQSFEAKLYNNETTRKFIENFPITYHMDELNGNEKYYYLQDNLPTDSQPLASINTGDIMLYGSNCLVVFYKNFLSNYSYTKLGYVENIDGFEKALGSGSIDITFE